MTLTVVSALGFALAVAACKKPSADNGAPSATAAPAAVATESAAPPTVISAEAMASDTPPPDSAKVPTQADYAKKATQVAAKQSLDTQVDQLAKQIQGQ